MADKKYQVRYMGALDALQHKMTKLQYNFQRMTWTNVSEEDFGNYKLWEDNGVADWETRILGDEPVVEKKVEAKKETKKATTKKTTAKKTTSKKTTSKKK